MNMNEKLVEEDILLEPLLLQKAVYIIDAINHKQRYRILRLLFKHDHLKVKQIYRMLNMEQSVASLHLSILRKAGLVSNKRKGQNVYYFPDYNLLNKFAPKNFRNIFSLKAYLK